MDGAAVSDVWEIGIRDHVDYTPYKIYGSDEMGGWR
jgi:hypothetical protein